MNKANSNSDNPFTRTLDQPVNSIDIKFVHKKGKS